MTTLTDEMRKLAETKPFYALAGGADLAVEKLREMPGRLQDVQGRIQHIADDRAALQERAVSYAGSLGTFATNTYDDLARRGRTKVSQVRDQEATHELEAQARTASRQTKAATTSTRKTAASAKKAASEGSEKIG